jgi:hypothetical protein
LDYPLRLFAEEEIILAFVFAGWGAISILISAGTPTFVRAIHLYEEVFRIILVPYGCTGDDLG